MSNDAIPSQYAHLLGRHAIPPRPQGSAVIGINCVLNSGFFDPTNPAYQAMNSYYQPPPQLPTPPPPPPTQP